MKKNETTMFVLIVLCALAVVIAAVLVLVNVDFGGEDAETTEPAAPSETVPATTAPFTTATVTTAPESVTAAPETDTQKFETTAPAPETTAVNTTVETVPATTPAETKPPLTPDATGAEKMDRTLFIGNSLVQNLTLYTALMADRLATSSSSVANAFTNEVIEIDGAKYTIADAIGKSGAHDRVYLMYGVNELGWESSSYFAKKYGELIDLSRAANPDAEIVLCLIYPVSKALSDSSPTYNMKNVAKLNGWITKLAEEKQCYLFDASDPVTGSDGYLLPAASEDGVHPVPYYSKQIYAYFCNHYDDIVAAWPQA